VLAIVGVAVRISQGEDLLLLASNSIYLEDLVERLPSVKPKPEATVVSWALWSNRCQKPGSTASRENLRLSALSPSIAAKVREATAMVRVKCLIVVIVRFCGVRRRAFAAFIPGLEQIADQVVHFLTTQ
jgi:hypothetical protein